MAHFETIKQNMHHSAEPLEASDEGTSLQNSTQPIEEVTSADAYIATMEKTLESIVKTPRGFRAVVRVRKTLDRHPHFTEILVSGDGGTMVAAIRDAHRRGKNSRHFTGLK